MIVAAIWYDVDQNAPSCPFLLDIAVPNDADAEDVKAWLRKHFAETQSYQAEPGEDPVLDSHTVDEDKVFVRHGGYYGDLEVTDSRDTFLLLSFSKDDLKRLGLKKAN